MHVAVEIHNGVEGENNKPRALTANQLSLVISPIWKLLCFPIIHESLYAAAGRCKTAGVEARGGGSRIQIDFLPRVMPSWCLEICIEATTEHAGQSCNGTDDNSMLPFDLDH
jgi:hypothetical protein